MMNEASARGAAAAEIALMWQTAPPRMPIPPPFLASGDAGVKPTPEPQVGAGKSYSLSPFMKAG